jgi:hypothetical protein
MKGLKFIFEVCWCWDLTKLPDGGVTSSPLRNKTKMGPRYWQRPKKALP